MYGVIAPERTPAEALEAYGLKATDYNCLWQVGTSWIGLLYAIEVAPQSWISRQEVKLKATFKRGKVIPGDTYSVLDLIPNYSVSADNEVTVEDHHGRRYHFTRPHWWPKDPSDPRRRYVKHYWSGNPELGVVTPVYSS